MNRIFFLIAVLGLFISCSNSKDIVYENVEFKDVSEANFKILTNELIIRGCSDIDYYKGNVIIAANIDDKMLHIYDAQSGEHLKEVLSFGRGNNEVSFINAYDLNQLTGDILLYDRQLQRSYYVNIDSLLQDKNPIIDAKLNLRPQSAGFYFSNNNTLLENESVININKEGQSRFCKFNDKGVISSTYNEFPLNDSVRAFHIYNQQIITMSRNREKMAVGISIGAILEIFDIENEIKNTKTCYFVEPQCSENGAVLETAVLGFMDMYATNKYIYTSYAAISGKPEMSSKDIAIFDWKGNPVKLIRTDCNVVRLCVNDDESRIYAFIQSDDGRLYIGYIGL